VEIMATSRRGCKSSLDGARGSAFRAELNNTKTGPCLRVGETFSAPEATDIETALASGTLDLMESYFDFAENQRRPHGYFGFRRRGTVASPSTRHPGMFN
jgi:hypothetical protein